MSLISSGQDWANIYWNIDRYFLQIHILRLAHWEGLSPLQRPWPDWKREVPANLHHGKLLSPFTLATATYLSPISTISNSFPISPFSHYILSVPYFTLLYPPFTFSSASASTDAMWYLEIFIFVPVSLYLRNNSLLAEQQRSCNIFFYSRFPKRCIAILWFDFLHFMALAK